jgi:glycosyltransferase involved in cell wall biosynthesis
MKIGFDAKRAFFNNTGLGNYSRNTLSQLFLNYPENEYILYCPSKNYKIKFSIPNNVRIETPIAITGKLFKTYWRSFLINQQLIKDKLDIFHGLSNELPFGITQTKIKTVVTIHDLIFKRFPNWYKSIDVKIYDKKFKYAATYSDIIVAVSKQTADDIHNFYKISYDKIRIIYQSCNPQFYKLFSKEEIKKILIKYNLPDEYLLYVGTIEERKNLHRIVEALIKSKINFPLVVVGRKTKYYYKKVLPIISANKLDKQIFFIDKIDNTELPYIYQAAKVFLYPSIFEGFGIPLLEAQASAVPVITSKGGCFKEVAGEHSFYVDPLNSDELADAIFKVLNDKQLRVEMIEKGRIQAKKFLDSNSIHQLYKIYEELL